MEHRSVEKASGKYTYRGFTIWRVRGGRGRRNRGGPEWEAHDAAGEEVCRTETLKAACALVDRRIAGKAPELESLEEEERLIIRVAYRGHMLEGVEGERMPYFLESRRVEWEAHDAVGEKVCRTGTLRAACALVDRRIAGKAPKLGTPKTERELIVRTAYRGHTIKRAVEGIRCWIEHKIDWAAHDAAGEEVCVTETLGAACALVDRRVAGKKPGLRTLKSEREFIVRVTYHRYIVERVGSGIYSDDPGEAGWEAYSPAGNQICGEATLQAALDFVERDIAGELPPLASPEDEELIMRAAHQHVDIFGDHYRGEVVRCADGCNAGLDVVALEERFFSNLIAYCRACGSVAASVAGERWADIDEGLGKRMKLWD